MPMLASLPSSGVFFSHVRPRSWGYGEGVCGPAGQDRGSDAGTQGGLHVSFWFLVGHALSNQNVVPTLAVHEQQIKLQTK